MESRRPAITRFAVYAAVVGAVLAVLVITGSFPSAEDARDFGEGLGWAAPVLFVPLFVLVNFVITWPILAGAAGLLFGTAAGTPLALAGVVLASLAQMAVARKLAGEHRGRLLPRRTRRIESFLTENGAVAVMESRVVPFLPWGAVNYSAGVTALGYRDMALGTGIGAVPKVFVYTALGGSLSDLASPEAIAALGLWVILALTGLLFVGRDLRARSA